jgi:hypothetical protein
MASHHTGPGGSQVTFILKNNFARIFIHSLFLTFVSIVECFKKSVEETKWFLLSHHKLTTSKALQK